MKTILVVGATGQQGRSVIRELCQHDQYVCLALTRNVASPKAQKLTLLGNVHLVPGDLNDIDRLREIFVEARNNTGEIWGVFVALEFPGLGASAAKEEIQGKNIATVANEFHVQSFVFSSVIPFYQEDQPPPAGLDRHTKLLLEKHIAGLSIPWTIVRPGFFMENLSPGIIGRLAAGILQHGMPPGCRLQLTAVDDIGRLARIIFDEPVKFSHKTMDLAGDCLTFEELNQAFIRATGHGLPSVPWFIIAIISWLNRGIRDLREEFLRGDETRRRDPNGFDANLREAASHLKPTSFEEWARNWDRWDQEINTNQVTLWRLITGNV